jgi:hypothetical protein
MHNSTNVKTISSCLSIQTQTDQQHSREYLSLIFSSIKYLAQQGFPLQGNDNRDNPLFNLVQERLVDFKHISNFIDRKDNWLSNTIQNEIIELMAHEIQRNVLIDVKQSDFYGFIADGTTDIAGNEQFSFSLQYSAPDLSTQCAFMGMYNAPDTKGSTLANVIMDILLRFDLSIDSLVAFSFDGAANMSGKYQGVQAHLREKNPHALYVHCLNHSLDLILQEAVRTIKGISEALQLVRDVGTLIRSSPKRKSIFASLFDDEKNYLVLSSVCPMRWSVRATALRKVKNCYGQLLECLEIIANDKGTLPDAAAKSRGLLKQSTKCSTFFFICASHVIFSDCEEVANVLQTTALTTKSAMECKEILQSRISYWRSDDNIQKLFDEVEQSRIKFGLSLEKKRIRTLPTRYRHTNEETHGEDGEILWKAAFFEALDLVTVELDRRFGQESLGVLAKREALVYENSRDISGARLPKSFNEEKLLAQLILLKDLLAVHSIPADDISKVRYTVL